RSRSSAWLAMASAGTGARPPSGTGGLPGGRPGTGCTRETDLVGTADRTPGTRYIALATFSAGLQAARKRMVWTDPGSLSTASLARTHGRGKQREAPEPAS